MGTMPSWYTSMYTNAKKAGGAQTYIPQNQQRNAAGLKPFSYLSQLKSVVGNGAGQIKPPGSPIAIDGGANPAGGAVVTTGYTPGTYTPGKAPVSTYTPTKRSSYEELLARANGILSGQQNAETVAYDNQIAAIKASLQNTKNSYNTQYTNDAADLNKQLGKDIKDNMDSASNRGMFWSTIPDIQTKELQTNNQDNLYKLKQIVNSNISNAENSSTTNEAGVLALKAALSGKYGSAAQELATNLLQQSDSTADNADSRAIELAKLEAANYNDAESLASARFNNAEALKADAANSSANRTSAESIASADRLSKEEMATLDRLEQRYSTNKNALTQLELQKMQDLQAKANREADAKIAGDRITADSSTSALDRTAEDRRLASQLAAQERMNAADNARSGANAALAASTSGDKSSTLTPQQMLDLSTMQAAVIGNLNTQIDSTYKSLKTPTTDSDWAAWQDSYDGILSNITSGAIQPEFQGAALTAFKNSPFAKKYQAELAKRGGGAKTVKATPAKSPVDTVRAAGRSAVEALASAIPNALATGKKNAAAEKARVANLPKAISPGTMFTGGFMNGADSAVAKLAQQVKAKPVAKKPAPKKKVTKK